MNAALLATIGGIAVLDSLNPSLFLAQFYLLTTARPVPRIFSYITGVVATNFLGGLVFLAGAQALILGLLARLSPSWLYGGGLALGIALLIVGLWMPRTAHTGGQPRQPRSLHPLHAFILGTAVMINELTTAVPYFVAIERITHAGLTIGMAVVSLAIYNLIFALPLFVFLALFIAYGSRFAAQTERISAAIAIWTPRVIKYGALLAGAFLALNAVTFFVCGSGLIT